ncbi:gag-pol polyprotein [Cucumis melo var. makuwa]|uniref:Gag-pol polyprotein n=1 Tax=Cucumis melo var. makuwa TaxID=1194695 RepID=A0A5A7UKN4_CUCMM|nr:gag-pol polyprotein [Cucumis melo var. makuwa]TYK29137.1 gag-pol polyprotein [Cucumis melo var. makuwa]
MVRKFKSMNTAGTTVKTERHDGENSTRKGNDFSYRRNSDHSKKKENIGRSFRCRECEGFGHYQAECPTYLRRQKKNYYVTLSGEDSDDDEVDHSMNAFTPCITEINSEVESECSDNDEDEELMLEKLKMLRKEDSEARTIQNERIQDLMEENEWLMGVISSRKMKLREVQNEYDQTIKSVKMLNSETDSLDSILNTRQNGSSKYGLRFDASTKSVKITPEVRFVPASVKETTEPNCENMIANTDGKSSRWVCYYCGRRGHIRPFCYKLLRDRSYHQKSKFKNHQNNYMFAKRNNDIRETHMIWRVKTLENCNVAFTTIQTHVDAWYFDI